MIRTLLLVIFCLIQNIICRTCIVCNHDPNSAGKNPDCVGTAGNSTTGNFTGEMTGDAVAKYSRECTEEGGTEFCYTLLTANAEWSNGNVVFPSEIQDMVVFNLEYTNMYKL